MFIANVQMLSIVHKRLVDSFCCFPLAVSQITAIEECDCHAAENLLLNNVVPTSDETNQNDATNCCAFLSVALCDKLLNFQTQLV